MTFGQWLAHCFRMAVGMALGTGILLLIIWLFTNFAK